MSKLKVLVVEDELVVARDIVQQLEKLGYDPVAKAARGEEAIEIVERLRPGFVLMDIHLAGDLDGIGAATVIRERFGTPVVFLTAFADDAVLQRAKIAEPFGYIIKPFEERELRSVIEIGLYKHRVEARLRESEAKFATAFRHSNAMVTLGAVDDGTFVEVNGAFLKASGFSAVEVLGKSPTELHWITAEDWARLQDQLRVHGRADDLEFTATAKDGRRLDCLASGGIVEIGGRPRLLLTVLDVTDRKRLEMHRRQTQKMEAVGQLVAGVAHDFNNILAATTMHLALLRDSTGIDRETKASILELEKEAVRGVTLTRQLLAFSRQQAMEVRVLLLDDLIENLIKMLRRILGERVTLEWDTQPGIPPIKGDTGMLEQVVVNLCVNARDAMPVGGPLRLRTDAVEVKESDVRTVPEACPGHYVRLTVSDQGCGMDEATQSRIFEPFFTTKEVGHGTGLGLATVHGIVKQHGGWIEVESEVGVGTTFRVFFPASGIPVEPAVAYRDEPNPRGHNELILVVEDEESVRSILSKTLGRYGYRLLLAKNGTDAIAQWAEHRSEIKLVLTDIGLPGGMTGADLIKRLRSDRPTISVIAVSGYAGNLGVSTMADVVRLPKPFDVPRLLRTVRDCIDEDIPGAGEMAVQPDGALPQP